MKVWKLIIATALAVVAVALLTASVFAYMGGLRFYSPNGAYAGGMMGGAYNNQQYPTQPNTPTPTTPAYPYQYGHGGCMRSGWNGYVGPAYSNNGAAITVDAAVTIAQRYLTSLNNPDLAIDEVAEYTQHFYV